MIQISEAIIEKLSSKGILAYVAVNVAGCGVYTSAALASVVHCTTAVMLEGMKDLADHQPEVVQWKEKKWYVGGAENPVGALQVQSERRIQLIDDLKKSWDHLNQDLPFSFTSTDGMAVSKFLRDHPEWTVQDWRKALNYRIRSEGLVRSQPAFMFLKTLEKYSSGPLDRYGKAMEHGPGAQGKALGVEAANRAAREAVTGTNRA